MRREHEEPGSHGSPGPESPKPARGSRFLRLFLENERRLYAYILTLLPNRADADDVLQDASVVMWEKFDEESPPHDFAAWGCRIAYYKVLEFFKKTRRNRVCFSQPMIDRLVETLAEHGSTLQLDERREALADCIAKLKERDRELLARRFASGATTQSTATELRRSLDAVYKSLAKIRHSLLNCVEGALA